jgi:hypothetical protein
MSVAAIAAELNGYAADIDRDIEAELAQVGFSALQLASDPTETDSWAPVPAAAILAGIESGELVGPIPSLLPRTDGVHLLYPRELHTIVGEPEAGKGWFVLCECARLLTAGERALYIDFEDTAVNVMSRLITLGVEPAHIERWFDYVAPDEALHPGAMDILLKAGPHAIVVLDGQSEAYALLGLDAYSNADIPKFLRALARPFAEQGAAVLLIDHVVKDKAARGRFALGGIHKLGGVAVSYGVEAIDPPSRNRTGTLKVTVNKDRHGHVRPHTAAGDVIALVKVQPDDDGNHVTVTVEPPDSTTAADGTFRPTVLMERVSLYLESEPGASARGIREGVKGSKHDAKDTALAVLVKEGYVDARQDGRARRHYSLRPYREATDQADRAHAPDRASTVPGTPESPCAHVPPPTGGTGQAHTTETTSNVPRPSDGRGEAMEPAVSGTGHGAAPPLPRGSS